MIKQKLNLRTSTCFNLQNKSKLFWSVSVIYTLLQVALCSIEAILSNRSETDVQRENTLPLFGYVLINTISVSVLVQAIFVLKSAVRSCFGLKESKTTVNLHLGLFLAQNVFFVVFLVL